jgi:hypothetical protein
MTLYFRYTWLESRLGYRLPDRIFRAVLLLQINARMISQLPPSKSSFLAIHDSLSAAFDAGCITYDSYVSRPTSCPVMAGETFMWTKAAGT